MGSDPGAVRRAEVARGDVALTVNDDGQGRGCVAEAPGDRHVGVEPGGIGRLVGLEKPPRNRGSGVVLGAAATAYLQPALGAEAILIHMPADATKGQPTTLR